MGQNGYRLLVLSAAAAVSSFLSAEVFWEHDGF